MLALNASLYLALRYLKPKRSFVSLVTLFLSVCGPIIGVALLIVVIAVMAGFNLKIREKILGVQAHIQLQAVGQSYIDDPRPILARLDELNLPATPVVSGPIPIEIEETGAFDIKVIRGIDPQREPNVSKLHQAMGEFDLTQLEEGQVLIGLPTAYSLGLLPGSNIIFHPPAKLTEMVRKAREGSDTVDRAYIPAELTVAGTFDLGMYDFDAQVLICHLETADEFFGIPWGGATDIQIQTPDPMNLGPIVATLRQDPTFSTLRIITWKQANRQLFDALQNEKNMMFFLLFFITIVAAFGIVTTLITVVVQKTREIGLLKAIGTRPTTILQVFVFQGTIVGLIGNTGGTILGLLIVKFRNEIAMLLGKLWGREIFPKELYNLSEIPAVIQPTDITMIVLSAQLICILASFIPALYASSLRPAEALHTGVE